MTTLRLRLPPAVSRIVSKFVKRLCALEGAALSEAVDWTKANVAPLSLEITIYKLIRQLNVRDAAKRDSAARVLELLGPVAAHHLVVHLWASNDTAFRLRLVRVMITIGPAARDQLAPAFIGLIVNQPEQALRDAGWDGLLRLGPACRAAAQRTERSGQ